MEDHTPTDQAAPRLASLKTALRAEARARREAIPPQAAAQAARLLAAQVLHFVLPRVPAGSIVAGYWPIGSEIDVRPALHALHDAGYRLALPETPPRGHPLRFRAYAPGQMLAAGRFGTHHPLTEEAAPALLLVPLLAFDRAGRRLGYGGGYYDRTLAALPSIPALGCAYAAQCVAVLPAGPHDAPLAAVATESGLHICRPPVTHRAPAPEQTGPIR